MSNMWRASDADTRSTTKTRISYDHSPGSLAWRDDRDDMESIRGGAASEISDDKITKFDELLRRIEAERNKMSAPESTPSRLGTIATPRRSDRGVLSTAASSEGYDFASRARELRMSDGVPARSGTPKRVDRERKENHFSQLARDMTPRNAGYSAPSPSTNRTSHSAGGKTSPSVLKSRKSLDGIPSYTTTPRRSESPSVRRTPPRSTGNTPMRSASPGPQSSSPIPSSTPSQEDFKVQVEKFHSSLVSAHDTIMTLEKDVRSLKKRVNEKEASIFSLENRNKSLNETLAASQSSFAKIEAERNTLLSDRNAMSMRHAEEMEKLRHECERFRRQAEETRKVSSENDAKVEEVQGMKMKLEGTIQDKDKMIGSLRHEIQRLNEELADGSFVRSQAQKAEETAKKFEAELEKSKADHASATKVIIDLEVRLKKKSEEFDRQLSVKEKEIATLQSELLSGNSIKQNSERMKEKVSRLESQLNDSRAQNGELSNKVEDLEKPLESAEKASKAKEEDIERLEMSALESASREKDLKRRLENEKKELERQRERFEKYDAGCATEQETVAALERAIEDLESAHNEGNHEIMRLQSENKSLSATLTEAEEFMKVYQKDMKESRNLKSMMTELRGINADLGEQLQSKEDQIRTLHDRIASIEIQVESSGASSKQAILQLENLVDQKEDEISRLLSELSSIRNSHDQEEMASKKLLELTALFEENEAELEEMITNKDKMLRNISRLEQEVEDLKKKETKSSHALAIKVDQDVELERIRKEAQSASARVRELEASLDMCQRKLHEADDQTDGDDFQINELKSELESVRAKLTQRDTQLADSRKSIAEAQKMIFRLMNTVQELRTKAKGRGQDQYIRLR